MHFAVNQVCSSQLSHIQKIIYLILKFVPESLPAISLPAQQGDLPSCYASSTAESPIRTIDPTPGPVELKPDMAALVAATEALVKILQEMVEGVSLLLDLTRIPLLTIKHSISKLHSLKPSSVRMRKMLRIIIHKRSRIQH